MSKLFVSEHPLIHTKMAMLRNKETGTKEFREIIQEVAMLLTYEATRDLPMKDIIVETPVAPAKCYRLAGKKLAIVPILRAGIGMVDGMLSLLPRILLSPAFTVSPAYRDTMHDLRLSPGAVSSPHPSPWD
ncbi:MAG: hypothetical protein IKI92_00160, partial [Anaerotignum sp.]|nr:hypothetical protein [Anaerotignum sp.]